MHSKVAWLALFAVILTQTWALPSVLLYTKTAGYRHDSIPTAVHVITSIGDGSLSIPSDSVDASVAALRWTTVNSEDESQFHNFTFLSQFDAIGFISTTDVDPPGVGTVLDDQGLRNFATYIQQGGGYFGVHSASATLFGAPFYGRLVGAFFDYHPEIQNVSVRPISTDHPSTSKLPEEGFRILEEMYNFRSDPRQLPTPANVLITNASSYQDGGVNPLGFRNGTNGPPPHPLAWWREGGLLDISTSTDPSVSGGGGANIDASGGNGRSWYTSLGHDNSTWDSDLFRGHIAGGVGWVLQSSTVRSNNGTAAVGQLSSSSTNTDDNASTTSSPQRSGHSNPASRHSNSGILPLGLFLLMLSFFSAAV